MSIVPNGSKILIWKQITTNGGVVPHVDDCSQWFKDTNLKANHNGCRKILQQQVIVPNGSKILIWKQITTITYRKYRPVYCSQWFKDTNLKANHNRCSSLIGNSSIVPNGSKILIWKQITTAAAPIPIIVHCSQWFKDTNLKANHNPRFVVIRKPGIVPNGSKILIWKQITTSVIPVIIALTLFPMVQRY